MNAAFRPDLGALGFRRDIGRPCGVGVANDSDCTLTAAEVRLRLEFLLEFLGFKVAV